MGVTNFDSVTLGSDLIVGGNLTVTGSTISAGETVTNLTATGNTILGDAVTDTLAVTGASTVTTTSASGLAVGRQGATSPVLKVNAATASVATGVEVIGAASGGNVQVNAIGGTNESLILAGKGTGAVHLGQATSTDVRLVADQAIADSSGNEFIKFSKTASAVNEITVTNGATGSDAGLGATGSDTNVGLTLIGQGTGLVRIDFGTKTATAAAGAVTLSKSSGIITTEALTTAADGTYTLTFTNTKIAATSIVFVEVGMGTCTTGRPVLEKVTPGAGSATIVVRNYAAAAALNGTLILNFLVLGA